MNRTISGAAAGAQPTHAVLEWLDPADGRALAVSAEELVQCFWDLLAPAEVAVLRALAKEGTSLALNRRNAARLRAALRHRWRRG